MNPPLLDNILDQPAALMAVRAHHLGRGLDAVHRGANLLKHAERVVLSGMGASFFASLPFSYRLNSRRHFALAVEASELLYFLDSQITSDTLLVLTSRSGESIEITKLLRHARARNAKVLGLTNVAESTLSRESDQTILIGSPADQLVAIQTYIATLAAFALLDADLNDELDVAASELQQTAGNLSSWIPQCVGARRTLSAFLNASGPMYLLGRGLSWASVQEGALLMHEISKSAAVGMTVAQFRHGPVEVVDGNFRSVIFGTQPATAPLDAALANDIARMGGQVRWIGPASSDSGATDLYTWPTAIPERFLPIAEILPLQVAAYATAELKGLSPGEFRWAPAVTASETGFAAGR